MARILSLIKEKLEYNPDTGELLWKISGHGIKKGSVTGSIANTGYVQIMVGGKQLLAHRVAFVLMTGRWPTEIDHINRVKTDNRWENLREVSKSENLRNRDKFTCKPYTRKGSIK